MLPKPQVRTYSKKIAPFIIVVVSVPFSDTSAQDLVYIKRILVTALNVGEKFA